MEIEFVKDLFLTIGYVIFKVIMEFGKLALCLTIIGIILLIVVAVKAWRVGIFTDDDDDIDYLDDDDESGDDDR